MLPFWVLEVPVAAAPVPVVMLPVVMGVFMLPVGVAEAPEARAVDAAEGAYEVELNEHSRTSSLTSRQSELGRLEIPGRGRGPYHCQIHRRSE